MEEAWHELYSRRRSNSAQRSQFSTFRHHIEQQCSAPLPLVLCGARPGYDGCNPRTSVGSRPQRYTKPEFPPWKKHVVAKKHFRPKAGGAPFITCYHCSKLVYLPEDFLLFDNRYCKLRCRACSAVLKFSVQNRTHIVPYPPNAEDLDAAASCSDDPEIFFCKSCYVQDKHSSEIEVQKQRRTRSPLHRLMGYCSPSLVIRGTGTSS